MTTAKIWYDAPDHAFYGEGGWVLEIYEGPDTAWDECLLLVAGLPTRAAALAAMHGWAETDGRGVALCD